MREPMFYCEHLPLQGETARLNPDETRHAASSRRLKAGDTLWLFDGRGVIAQATYRTLADRGRTLEAVIEARKQHYAPTFSIHMACALPKGDRAAILIDMATQLGMSDFIPLLCEHNVVKPNDSTAERLRRTALEACKQSRRPFLPTIHAPQSLDAVIQKTGVFWIAHPNGKSINELPALSDSAVTLLIGPEGGFSEREVAAATARGVIQVGLGESILRVETAAITLLIAAAIKAGISERQ